MIITEETIAEISTEQFGEWKHHPVTQAFFYKIQQQIEELETNIKKGNTLRGDSSDILRETSRWLGVIEGLEAIVNFTWE